uniref:TPR_21 domain-containing protein n=1 Tax=Angiostrongylus cantonensis TaxID=6313 RepID=A0A158P5Q0_ANGCA
MFEQAVAARYLDGYVGKMAIYSSRQLANDMKAVAKVRLTLFLGDMKVYFSQEYFFAFGHGGCSSAAKGIIPKRNSLRVAISLNDVEEAAVKVKELMAMDSDDPYATLGVNLKVSYLFSNTFSLMINTIKDFALFGLIFVSSKYFCSVIFQPIKAPDETLKTAERILNIIVDNCPGISQAYFILARCYFLHSECDAADRMIKQCLQKNETIADAYLLRAEIKLMKGQVADADSCLNTGLSFNFSVRESPLFHLIKAKLHKQKNEIEKAADLLKAGLKLPQKERSTNLLMHREGGNSQRKSIQLELIDCLQSMKQTHEAERIMREALEEWKGKPEEEQLLLMNAQLHVTKGDVDGALAILNTVQPGQPNYHSARIKMAEIFLQEKHDKTMFTVCYKELLKSAPTSATYALLGDAYMSVQEPDKAIEAYEMALKMQTKDMVLAEKIGEAYVLCHLYAKAVNFYESVMNTTKDKRMRLKLADLLHKLGNNEKCMRILRQPLDEEPNPTGWPVFYKLCRCFHRIYHVRRDYRHCLFPSEAFPYVTKYKCTLSYSGTEWHWLVLSLLCGAFRSNIICIREN